MGHSHDCDLKNLRMLMQHILNFPSRNIFTTTNNDVFFAVGDNDGTLSCDMPYITCIKVSAIIYSLPSLLLFAIAEHHCRPLNQNLSI